MGDALLPTSNVCYCRDVRGWGLRHSSSAPLEIRSAGINAPAGPEGRTRFVSSEDERPESVRVWLLGDFKVSVGTRPIGKGAWRLKKASALLKLLSLAPDHRMHL